MSFYDLLRCLRSALLLARNSRSRSREVAARIRPQGSRLESLEGRQLLAFTPAVNYATTAAPADVVTADFNGDGKLDLASVVGYSNSKVSVRLGDGAGGFGAAQDFAAPGYDTPTSIFIADFNNDTKPDIVVSEFNGFSTLIGNGDGTFQPAVYTYIGGVVAVGRFNGDDNIDIMVTWLDGDWATHIQVYSGNGQGGFAPALDAYDGYYWGWGGMVAVDLNNDGHIDVATGEGVVFLGYGNGALQWFNWDQPAPLSSGRAVVAGDFTGDGNADVISAGDDVAVLRGRGDGTFDAPIRDSINGFHTAVATADFNADGNLDAIVTDSDAATVSVMLGNGDGTLRFGGAFATGTSPAALTIGDFNGDGRSDVAVANAGSNNLSVLLNDGIWNTVPPVPLTLSISDTTVTEGDAGTVDATFAVTLTRPSPVDVTVRYDTVNITATAATDYVAASGTLTIPAGQTSQTFTIAIRNDRLAELTETFAVNLSNSINAPIADGQAIGTILDNEPRITISDVSRLEGRNRKSTLFTFTVTLSAAYDQPMTMSYRTSNGTATTVDNDYVARSGTLTFAPGEATKTISIEVKGDSKREANETFYLDLFGNSSNSLLNKSRGIGTILNDD